jgi:hypothetical protein
MIGIRGRLERLRSSLGPEPTPEYAIVSIGCVVADQPRRPAVEWYDAGMIGCPIPEPTAELAEALVRLHSLSYFGVELEHGPGMDPEDRELRCLVLASAVDDRQRRILAGVPAWHVGWEPQEMDEWLARHGIRGESP